MKTIITMKMVGEFVDKPFNTEQAMADFLMAKPTKFICDTFKEESRKVRFEFAESESEKDYQQGKQEVIDLVRNLIAKEDFICDKGHDIFIDNVAKLLNNIEKGVQ